MKTKTFSEFRQRVQLQWFVTLFLFVASLSGMHAQVIFTKPFTGASGCPNPGNVAASGTGWSAPALTLSTATCAATANVFNTSNWQVAAIDANRYMEFQFTVNSGYQATITSASFSTSRSTTGAPNGRIAHNNSGNFTTDLSAFTVTTTLSAVNWDFTDINLVGPATLTFRIYGWGASAAGGTFRIDDLSLNGTVTSTASPSITVSSASLPDVAVVTGAGASAANSYTVSGLNLGGDITITPPTHVELSTVGAAGPYAYTNSTPLTLSPSSGTVASTTVWARIASGSPIGIIGSNITHSSTGATTENVVFNGQVFAEPRVVVNQAYNASTVTEWYELLTTQNIDLSNWILRDYSASAPNTPDQLTFNAIPFWSNIPAGTFIVIYQPGYTTPVEDLDPSDGVIRIQACNAIYFTQSNVPCSANTFAMNANQDAITLINGSGSLEHAIEWNTSATQYSGVNIVRYPKAFVAGAAIAAGASVWYQNANSQSAFYNDANLFKSALQTPANATEGASNDATEQAWVCGTLRGVAAPTSPAVPTVTNITSNSMDLNWSNGNGSNRIVVQRLTATAAVAPVNGTSYSTGGTTGAGNTILFAGTGTNTYALGGLPGSTSYTFDIYEYNGSGECVTYASAASVTAATSLGVGIISDPVTGTPFCVSPTSLSANFNMDFSTTGTFNVGNTFTVQLSNSAGSFASPINIGAGSATGIACIIPPGTPAGAGYLVRVVSSDPVSTSNTQSIAINSAPVNVTGQAAVSGSSQVTINWTNPTAGCFDDIMIVAKAGAFTAAVPTGNTLASNSNSFTDPLNDAFDGGVVVYKGSSPGQVITNLTNATAYTFKIFTRTGNDWSNGVTVSSTPVFAMFPGDIQFIGMNTSAPDGFSFVTWVNIPAGTVIRFMDNGFISGASANAANNCQCTENAMTWTAPAGGIAIGTVINIMDVGTANASANFGTCVGRLNGLSGSGDQIFAFTGAAAPTTNPGTFTGNILAGINIHPSLGWLTTGVNSSNTSYLPSELVAAPQAAINFTTASVNAAYNASRSNQTAWAAYKPVVANSTNWVTSSAAYNPFSGVNFTLSAGLPQVTLNVSTSSGTEAAGTVVTVTASATGTLASAETVDLSISGLGITAGDYNLSNAVITIPAGTNPTGSVTFTIVNDTDAEGIETATLTISNPSSGIELSSIYSRDITIADNDVPNLVISEIMYDGPGVDNEWIEVFNAGSTAITINNLYQLQSTGAAWTYTFTGSTTIAPGQYFTIQVGTNGSFPFVPTFVAFPTGTDRLTNTSSTLTLKFNGLTVDAVTYGSTAPWPGGLANGSGSTVALNQTSLDNSLGSNWGACYVGGTPNAPNINCNSNIYYTVSSGNLTDAIWSTYPNGPAIYATFSNTTDLVVMNTHTVVMNNASPVNVRNLTINGGAGKIWRNSSNVVNMAYFNVFGNLVNNGIIGNGSTFDAIGFNFEGTNSSITGNGTFNIGRIRKTTNTNATTNLSINAGNTVNLRYPGTAIYNEASSANLNITIPAGRTVIVAGDGSTNGSASIDGVDGLGLLESGGTYTINGTLRVFGIFYGRTNNTNALYSTGMNLGATGNVILNNFDLRIDGGPDVGFPVNITAGGRITVSGVMRNLAGTFNTNGGLLLTATARLLHGTGTPGLAPDAGGDVTGNVIIKRAGSTTVGVYNFWSSPVSGATLTTIAQNGLYQGSAANTYAYDPSMANGFTVEGYRAGWVAQSLGTTMSAGNGYITTTGGTAVFTGPVNNGTINVPVIQGPFTRFNLVGNPYPSAISAGSFITANAANITGGVYFWDDDQTLGSGYATSDYIVTNLAGTSATGGNGNASNFLGSIASGQGFFVEALPAATQVTFTNAMRNDDNAAFFDVSDVQRMWVKLEGAGVSNQTLVAFSPNATDAFDNGFDARKLAGNENISLYTRNDEAEIFAIQTWKNIRESLVVELGMDLSTAGNYTMSIPALENIDESVLVYLEDRETGAFYNLRQAPFHFTIEETIVNSSRFALHFTEPVTVAVRDVNCDASGSIQFTAPAGLWNYELMNAEGMPVSNGTVASSNQVEPLQAGTYTLHLYTNDGYSLSNSYEVLASGNTAIQVSGNTTAQNGAVAFEAGQNAETVVIWNMGDGTSLYGNAINYQYQEAGVYTVTVSAGQGNCQTTEVFQVHVTNVSTGTQTIQGQLVSLYPNPASDVIRVNTLSGQGAGTIEITDVTGKSLLRQNLNTQGTTSIETSNLASGLYVVRIVQGDREESLRLNVAH